MRVKIRQLANGRLMVTRRGALVGPLSSDGHAVVVVPGQKYRGYRFRRLRRLGETRRADQGVQARLTKDGEKRAQQREREMSRGPCRG